MDAVINWLSEEQTPWLLGGVVVLLLALIILQRVFGLMGRGVRAFRRMGKPVELHPRLQAYAGHTEEEIARDEQAAMQIIATSSTLFIAGYELVRQVEAVFVEGYRTPQEASTALKATAARRGANAIINLTHQRTAAGKCAAQGDAVVIEPAVARQKPDTSPKK